MSANLAQAERAAALWPNKGEKDLRPIQGSGYRRIEPTEPRSPIVPVSAPGALRLPIIPVRRVADEKISRAATRESSDAR